MLSLKVIISSTREGRNAEHVIPWLLDRVGQRDDFDVDVLDLRDWPLPMFRENMQTIGDITDPTYSDPIVKQWNQRIKQGDAFLFLTTEYNHSIPGELKNAIDNVFVSFAFRNKPSAFVGYSTGSGAGVRAIEHLAQILIEAESAPLRNTVIIPNVTTAFEGTSPKDARTDASLTIALDDLAWWATALQQARAAGELPPGSFRLRAAMAARNA